MEEKINNQKGITLVALVITIIVLMILAGIGIGQIFGEKNSISESKEETAFSELTKIQQAIIEKYIKYQQFKNKNILIGEEIDYNDAQTALAQIKSNEELKVSNRDGVEFQYYKLTVENLKILGLENIHNNDEYIVNYATGEVMNITQKKTKNGGVLYIYAKEIEPEYIKTGLVLHYDGINNIGQGDNNHSNTTTIWKDLSGNGNDGTINSAILGDNYVQLDGEHSWVNCGEINNDYTTLEVVMEAISLNDSRHRIFGNWQNSGCGLYTDNIGRIISDVYTDGWKSASTSANSIVVNKKYYIALTYDGHNEIIYINGLNKTSQAYEGTIMPPSNNTVMCLGCDPNGNNANQGFLNGKIYSARIYNKALSSIEVANNFQIDKSRFGIEDEN